MPNSIEFNEYMFLTGAVLALAFIVYGLILTQKRPPDAPPPKYWLAHRMESASVCAEEQAEQIIRSCWPEEVV